VLSFRPICTVIAATNDTLRRVSRGRAVDFLAPRWKKTGVSTAENWRALSIEKTARRTMAR